MKVLDNVQKEIGEVKTEQIDLKVKTARLTRADFGLTERTPLFTNEHLYTEYKVFLAQAIAAKKQHSCVGEKRVSAELLRETLAFSSSG